MKILSFFVHTCLAVMASAALLTGCGGDSDNDKTQAAEDTESTESAALAFHVGINASEEELYSLSNELSQRLTDQLNYFLIPAVIEQPVRTLCPPGAELDGTRACYDYRVFLPALSSDSNDSLVLENLLDSFSLQQQLTESDYVTFVDYKGKSDGRYFPLFFAARQLIDHPTDGVASSAATPVSRAATAAEGCNPDTDDNCAAIAGGSLKWWNSTSITTGGSGYQKRVLAPYFTGKSGSNGSWVLTGLEATVNNEEITCLRGIFNDLAQFSGDRFQGPYGTPPSPWTVENGNCNSNQERIVRLDTEKVITSVSMKASDNNVTGLGLGWANPASETDVVLPDFLRYASPDNFIFDGSSSGRYAPGASSLTAAWPYVVVGVEASASKSEITDLTVYLGQLAPEQPADDDTWLGIPIADIEEAVDTALNTTFDAVASNLTFDLYSGCTSTIGEIRFCGHLAVEETYNANLMDPACTAGCETYYESCQIGNATCDTADEVCGWFGESCSCSINCGKERDKCYNGCPSYDISGGVEVDVKNVKGLDSTNFSDSNVPFLTDADTIGVETSARVKTLSSDVYWRVWQEAYPGVTAIDIHDTTTMKGSDLALRTRARIDAEQCASGTGVKLSLSIEAIDVVDPGSWAVGELSDEIIGASQSSLDWLSNSLDDLFSYDLQDDYEDAMTDVIESMLPMLNGMLGDIVILDTCQ